MTPSENHEHTRFHRWLLRLLPLGALISMVALLLGALVLINDIRSGNQQSDKVCRVAQRGNDTLRHLLVLAQKNSVTTLKDDPVRLKASRAFYREALKLLPPIDCEKL
jgi:hypothetical protein